MRLPWIILWAQLSRAESSCFQRTSMYKGSHSIYVELHDALFVKKIVEISAISIDEDTTTIPRWSFTHSVYDRILAYYMIQYYDRIFP